MDSSRFLFLKAAKTRHEQYYGLNMALYGFFTIMMELTEVVVWVEKANIHVVNDVHFGRDYSELVLWLAVPIGL